MANDVKSLNGLFKETYKDSVSWFFEEEKWVPDTKIARKLHKNEVLEEREGYLKLKDGGLAAHPNDPAPKYRSGNAKALAQSMVISGRRLGKPKAASIQTAMDLINSGIVYLKDDE